jgi:hypothetical protein
MASKLAKFVTGLPVIGPIAVKVKKAIFGSRKFPGSQQYWETLYAEGGNSGEGSYSNLAAFKAEILNAFVADNNIASVMEFGCGDGNQLSLAKYPRYTGLDVSPTVIKKCIAKFKSDDNKSFFVYDSLAFQDNQGIYNAELCLSLDVLYHLIEDDIFNNYMNHLFAAAGKYVIIYSSNFQKAQKQHEIDRVFTDWVEANQSGWQLVKKIDNPYKADPKDPVHTSKADFYIYEKI